MRTYILNIVCKACGRKNRLTIDTSDTRGGYACQECMEELPWEVRNQAGEGAIPKC